ncbi:MAG TPA: hypothetical protein VFS90_11035 [Pyrinomonadaceae bacterium]|nr:hypothetical protein [Pyrinomonadaceae bacterium]
MRSQCGPPKFDAQDFSKFDFSRWHLDGLTLDSAATAVAGLTEKLFTSEEWNKHFQATLPEFKTRSLELFKQQLKDLQKEREETAKDFENRAKAADQLNIDFRNSIEVTAAPVVIDAAPNIFQGSVRLVSEKDPRLGLPGLRVQIIDPKDEKTVLLESISDLNGNVILTFPPEITKDRDQRDLNLQIVDPENKPITKIDNAICIRLGQTEERVVKIPESEAIKENKKQALETRSDRENRAAQLATRGEILRRERQKVLEVLDCRLRDTGEIIAELEKPPVSRAPSPAPTPETPAADEPGEDESPASQPKRGKKKK